MIELGQILAGLVRRTEEGRLKWRRVVENDRFVTSVDAISIVIQEIQAGAFYRLDIHDESEKQLSPLLTGIRVPNRTNNWQGFTSWPAVPP